MLSYSFSLQNNNKKMLQQLALSRELGLIRGGVETERQSEWTGVGGMERGGEPREATLFFWFYLLFSCSRSLQPTAVMSAAPFPLPSSDSRKLTEQCGASSFTVCCMILEKLDRKDTMCT